MHWIRQFIVYLTVATLLFLSIYSYFQFSEYKKYTNSVEHTHTVLNTVERLRGNVYQLMALRRAYLIDPNLDLKEQLIDMRESTIAITDSLFVLVDDNDRQIKNIARIRSMYTRSALFYDYPNPPTTLPAIQLQMRSSYMMNDSIFNELRQVKKIETQLLGIRSTFQADSGSTVPLMLLGTGLIAISMLFYAFYTLDSELRARLAAKNALEQNVFYLNEANTELERFAFIASHNLKEPVRKSRTFISRILPEINPAGPAFPQLQKVEKLMANMQIMLDDLLDYTHLLKHSNVKEQLNLHKVIDVVLKTLNQKITETGATVEIEKLPEITGYADQLNLVFTHLLANALKYSKPDVKPVIKITHSLHKESGHHVIVVADNGIGFDNFYNTKIFEIFGRLHSKDEYDGTGIGLPICRRVMFNHDGFIQADGSVGIGARFSLYFPVG